jgi:membrane protein implicated in regulation of membrane protease activity
MLFRLSPVQMMLIGFVLLVIGFVLPFVMVLQIIESTLFLGFVAYLTSFLGLIIGLIGVVMQGRVGRRDDDER